MTNLTLAEGLKSTFYQDAAVYSKTTVSFNPKYITATKFCEIKAAIDQLIKTIGPAINKK